MPSATAQMNIRLLPQVKEAGDQALARMGVTPTEFVRSIWEKLAEDGEERSRLEAIALGQTEASETNPQVEALARARRLYADGMARLRIDLSATGSDTALEDDQKRTDRELCLEALAARMEERGTW